MVHHLIQKMTHFVVLIIIPRKIYLQGDVAIRKYIEEIMAPYYEDLRVIPYIYQTKAQFEEEYQKFKASGIDREGKFATIERYRIDYCGHDMVDHDGNILSCYNKDCFWDCYEVGGRWNGDLLNRDRGEKVDVEEDQIADNSISVESFLKLLVTDKGKYTYGHLLDQNGSLHRSREMGWFASYNQLIDDKEWESRFEQILGGAIEDFIVALDCHI